MEKTDSVYECFRLETDVPGGARSWNELIS